MSFGLRVFLFFAWFIGSILVPWLIGFWLTRHKEKDYVLPESAWRVENGRFADAEAALGGPLVVPPTDMKPMFPEAEAAVAGIFPDQTRVLAIKANDVESRQQSVARYMEQTKASRTTGTSRGTTYTTAAGEHALIVADGAWALCLAGPNKELVNQRLAALPGLQPNPERRIGNKLDREWKPVMIGAIVAWVLVIAFLFGRIASWAGGSPAAPTVEKADAATLKSRLLAINQTDVPFTVSEGSSPNELLVDWRYADTKWTTLMRTGGLTKAHRILLRLDDDGRRVRAQDQSSSLEWSAGSGVTAAELSWEKSWGITFVDYQHRTMVGLQIKDGRITADPAYSYTFNLAEMKTPVIKLINDSGWDYRPVITFWRPLGG